MIVCVCRGVSDRKIREEAAAGHTLEQVCQRTGAGSSCGMCRCDVARLVAETHRAVAREARETCEQTEQAA